MSEKIFELRFSQIELVSKRLALPQSNPEKQDINFNFLVDIRLSQEKKLAVVSTEVTIFNLIDKSELAYIKIFCAFEFPDFENVFKKIEDNVFELPLEIEILLKSAGLSTARGVIYSELRGTYLQNAVLPLIDISSIIIKDRQKQVVEDNKSAG
jgi:hypothetical protein